MTPEELQALVLAGATEPLVEALAPLDEGARRTLAERAFELYRAANDFERKTDLSKLLAEAGPGASRCSELAVLACCDGTKAKRMELFSLHMEGMLAVLVARRPAWIDGWISNLIDKRWLHGNWWPVIRGLIRAGIASKPAASGYINLMVHGLAWRNWRKGASYVPLSTLLLEDSGLLEFEVWRLFETEHRAFGKDWVAARPNRPENYETWTAALVRLAKAGHVDRARLIDAALSGMSSGLKPAAIGGFVNFAEALEVTAEELSTRQGMLCQLLSNQIGTAVAFALQGLSRLEKAKLLDRDGLLEMIEPALLFPKKSQAIAAVALLKAVAKADEVRRPQCLLAATRALANVSGEVQRRATELIEAYPASSDGQLRASVDAQIGSVAPTVRERLSALSTDDGQREVSTAADIAVMENRVSRLPATVAERWGLRQAIDGMRSARGAQVWPKVAPREADYQPLPPIGSPDELLEAIALAVESVSGADEIERLIDGVARYADRRPDSKVGETVLKRFLAPTSMKGLTSGMGIPPPLVHAVAMWFGVDATGRNFNLPESWWMARLAPYLKALRQKRAWHPLSTPTHAGGWIDPRIWIARVIASADSIDDSDGIQSLLRLAPFGRDEARRSIEHVPGVWRRLAEYALGGDCRVGMTDVFRSPLWVAAGRARQPVGELHELRRLPGISNVPDALRESHFNLQEKKPSDKAVRFRPPNSESTYLPLDASFDADVNQKMDNFPQCLFYPRKSTQRFSLEWTSPWVIEWKSQIWPTNLRGFLYRGINRMLQRFEASSSVYEPNHVYIDALRPHQRSLGDIEHMALAIACMSGEQEVRRSAGEVLVRAGIEGRLDAGLLAARLGELFAKGWFSINRLATTLEIAARDSPQTASVAVETLFTFLTHQTSLPKGAHDALDVLYQQSHRLGISAPELLKEKLSHQLGGTKTARLANDLLALKASTLRARAADLEAIHRLLERAEAEAAAGQPAMAQV